MNTSNTLLPFARPRGRGIKTQPRFVATLLLMALVPDAALNAQQSPARPAPSANSGSAGQPSGRVEAPTTLPATQPTRRGFGGFSNIPTPVLGEGPTCTLDAIIYELRMPVERIGWLDVAALNNAADSAESFEKALAALGTAKPMYRASQTVRLSGDTVQIGSQAPYVSNTRVTDTGQSINTVSYASTGAIFSLVGKESASGVIDMDLSIQLSSMSDSTVTIGNGIVEPSIYTSNLMHKGPVRPSKPFVVMNVNAAALDKDGKAMAFISRVTVRDPQPPAAR